MMDETERLKRELAIARETNRRLNRRCQELEHEITSVIRDLRGVVVNLNHESYRTWRYANILRDLYHRKERGLDKWYESHWKRLPKPENEFIDSISQRVNEALRLIEEGEKR